MLMHTYSLYYVPKILFHNLRENKKFLVKKVSTFKLRFFWFLYVQGTNRYKGAKKINIANMALNVKIKKKYIISKLVQEHMS